MEKSSIEMIKKMVDSLERLASAWYDVRNCWEDGEVMEVMARMCDIYPFDRSFDEMTDEVDTWAYLTANELRKVSVIEEQWNKIEIGSCNEDLTDATIHFRYFITVETEYLNNIFMITPNGAPEGCDIIFADSLAITREDCLLLPKGDKIAKILHL